MKLICAVAMFFSFFAQAEVFKVQDEQFRKKTMVYVTRAVSNGLANEQLMNDIIRDMHATLLHELYQLNATNQIPDQLIKTEDVKRFVLRQSEMAKLVKGINNAIVPTRMAQPREGVQAGDLVPDAIMLYYPLLPEKFGVLAIPAVVGTIVKRLTYELPTDDSCATLTVEQIKADLQKRDTDQVGSCKLKLIDSYIDKDYAVIAMVGVDKKFFNGPRMHKSAGIGFLWDTNSQFNTAVDVVGFGASVSVGSIVQRFAKVGGKLVTKLSEMAGWLKPGPKGLNNVKLSPAGLDAIQQSLNVELPTRLNIPALLAAFKNANNYRIGGIYSDFELAPTYVMLSFDLSGVGLKDVFGTELDSQNLTPVDPTKGPALKVGAFAFAPYQWVKKTILGQWGAVELFGEQR